MNAFSPKNFFSLEQFSHKQLFEDIDFVWDVLKEIQPYLKNLSLGEKAFKPSSGVVLINEESITIEPDVILEEGSYVRGPCYLGRGTVVRHGAYIRGNVITGENCVIGHGTEVKNSLFLDGVRAGHFSYVGDTILGSFVNLGAGTKCANLLLNPQAIEVRYHGELFSTGLRKFGAVLGDRVQTGCNTVTNPGTIFGKNVHTYPCVAVGGVVPANTTVKASIMRYDETRLPETATKGKTS